MQTTATDAVVAANTEEQRRRRDFRGAVFY